MRRIRIVRYVLRLGVCPFVAASVLSKTAECKELIFNREASISSSYIVL